jgi:long-subunit fatty acid transport protein
MNKVLMVLPLFLCWGLMLPPASQALDNGASWFDWQYRLDEPGARGRGMGGATVAVTNDASATLVNPAALTEVAQIELVVEARAVHLDERSTAGQVDNTGNPLQMGLQAGDSDQLNLSHVAMAVPLGKSRTVFGIFYHRLALMDRTIIASDPRDASVIQVHEPMFAVDEIGASLATDFWSGKLALGLSGSLVTLNMDSKVTVGDSPLVGGPAGREYLFYSQSEQEPIWRLGLLWKPTPRLRIGIKQTLMPTIDYKLSTVDSKWITDDPEASRCTPTAFSDGWVCESTLPIPDVFAVGIAYQLSDRLTLAGELKSIKYSERTHKFNAIFVTPGSDPEADLHPEDFSAEDVVEVHLGVEWLCSATTQPIQLRAGYYFDPAHDIRYRGSDATTAAIYYGGEDVHHGTFGVGIPFGIRNRIDVAIDIASDGRNQGLLGLLWRF